MEKNERSQPKELPFEPAGESSVRSNGPRPTSNGRNPLTTSEHRTVSRVMSLLEAVVANEPAGLRLGSLSDLLGAPKSTIHGLARGLVTTGHLSEHQGRYFQGPAMSMFAIAGRRVPAIYRHALGRLASDTNETAILATVAGDYVINIDIAESNQLIRATPPLHERRPMWPGSYGKIFVAHMARSRQESYLRRRGLGADNRILEEIERIRQDGVAFNFGESNPDLYGIASPLLVGDNGDGVTLAIGIAGPAQRMAAHLIDNSRHVISAADSLRTRPDCCIESPPNQ